MLHLLALCTLLLTAADHWTTYLCLRSPVDGYLVYEANPIAAWLFARVGLGPGLLVDTAITLVGLVFLLRTSLLRPALKVLFLGVVIAATALAVSNNLRALDVLGVTPSG